MGTLIVVGLTAAVAFFVGYVLAATGERAQGELVPMYVMAPQPRQTGLGVFLFLLALAAMALVIFLAWVFRLV